MRGFLVKINDGAMADRIVAAWDLDSVEGTLERGRTDTSNVAWDASSAARRTSMGPETDARAAVSPEAFGQERVSMGSRKWKWSPNANRAEPSTLASPS